MLDDFSELVLLLQLLGNLCEVLLLRFSFISTFSSLIVRVCHICLSQMLLILLVVALPASPIAAPVHVTSLPLLARLFAVVL